MKNGMVGAGLVLAALGGLGCSASDEDAQNAPSRRVRGEIVSAGPSSVPVDVGVVWFPISSSETFGDWNDHLIATPIAAADAQGSSFTLTLDAPPPREVATEYTLDDGVRPPHTEFSNVFLGAVAALSPGIGELPAEIQLDDVRGVALDRGVAYFERDGNASDPSDEIVLNAAWLGVEPTRGYHLYVIDSPPEERAALRQCRWSGLCIEYVGSMTPGAEALDRAEYERCALEVPDAEHCRFDTSETLSAAQQLENERCVELTRVHRTNVDCPYPDHFPGNALGFELPVNIELGVDIRRWYFQD